MRLGGILLRPDLAERAKGVLQALGGVLQKSPFAAPELVVALDLADAESGQLVLAGVGDAPPGPGDPLRIPVDREFFPRLVVIPLDKEAREVLAGEASGREGLGDMRADGNGSTAYLCRGTTCQAPARSADELAEQLRRVCGGTRG